MLQNPLRNAQSGSGAERYREMGWRQHSKVDAANPARREIQRTNISARSTSRPLAVGGQKQTERMADNHYNRATRSEGHWCDRVVKDGILEHRRAQEQIREHGFYSLG
jgi:hypothetical protein